MLNHGIQAPEYRLPAETTVGRVILRVRDLPRSTEFYQSLLGFSVIEQTSALIRLGVGERTLVELHGGATHPRGQRRLGLYHFAILLPDRSSLGSCLRHLVAHGINPGAADHLVSEALYLQDPDGLGIEIYRDRPREEWRVVGQQLAMASDPLDFDGLIESAGPTWEAMPGGTRMGHIHLHVGDLLRAQQFYHGALGLDLVVWSYPGALFLSAGGYHHHVGLNTWAGPYAEAAPEHEAQLQAWNLVLPSQKAVAMAVGSLADHGFTRVDEPDGVAQLADPWGTRLRLTTEV